ncbi:hypothetical protein D3C71_1581120 [compost metagenome]
MIVAIKKIFDDCPLGSIEALRKVGQKRPIKISTKLRQTTERLSMANNERNFSIRDLIIALLREQKISSGYWGLTMHFTATGTAFTSTGQPEVKLPGLAVSVSGLTLVPAKDGEEGSIDASQVNPLKSPRRKKRAITKSLD